MNPRDQTVARLAKGFQIHQLERQLRSDQSIDSMMDIDSRDAPTIQPAPFAEWIPANLHQSNTLPAS